MIYLYGLLEEPASGHEVLAGMAGVTGPIALARLPGGILIYSSATEADILPRRRLLPGAYPGARGGGLVRQLASDAVRDDGIDPRRGRGHAGVAPDRTLRRLRPRARPGGTRSAPVVSPRTGARRYPRHRARPCGGAGAASGPAQARSHGTGRVRAPTGRAAGCPAGRDATSPLPEPPSALGRSSSAGAGLRRSGHCRRCVGRGRSPGSPGCRACESRGRLQLRPDSRTVRSSDRTGAPVQFCRSGSLSPPRRGCLMGLLTSLLTLPFRGSVRRNPVDCRPHRRGCRTELERSRCAAGGSGGSRAATARGRAFRGDLRRH